MSEKMVEIMMIGEMMVSVDTFKKMENKIIKLAKANAKENYLKWDKRLDDFARKAIRETQSEMIKLVDGSEY